MNHYGPSETTIGALTHELDKSQFGNRQNQVIPIGQALPNTQTYILNTHQQLCPEGVEGELYIGGEHVSRGYLNRPELSQESFIENPFRDLHENEPVTIHRLYKTGDKVKRLNTGDLVFVGRVDQQVKVRGYRVELGDISSALLSQKNVSNAFVAYEKIAEKAHAHLIAWVVTSTNNSDVKNDIFTQLKQQLPSYMVPQEMIVLDSMPVTANGKPIKRLYCKSPNKGK